VKTHNSWPQFHVIRDSPTKIYNKKLSKIIFFRILFLFFFNRHCNPCGFWPAQLSLNILSRKVFTDCRCQRHVKPPNLEDQWLERFNSCHQVSPASEATRANPSSGRWKYGREIRREICRKWRIPRHFWVLLHAVNLRHGTDGFT